MPLAFMMGVSWEDSFIVAELIGTKTFMNELLAFQKMSKMIKLRDAGGPEYVDNVKQYISVSLIMYNCKAFFCLALFFSFLFPLLLQIVFLKFPFEGPLWNDCYLRSVWIFQLCFHGHLLWIHVWVLVFQTDHCLIVSGKQCKNDCDPLLTFFQRTSLQIDRLTLPAVASGLWSLAVFPVSWLPVLQVTKLFWPSIFFSIFFNYISFKQYFPHTGLSDEQMRPIITQY